MKLSGMSKKGNYVRAGQLRRAQLVTTYGPGAIADFPDNCSVVMASIDSWQRNRSSLIGEPRLERLLGVGGFMEPACTAGEDGPEKGLSDIPAWRFPFIGFCPACGRLGLFTDIGRQKGRKYYCKDCQDKPNQNKNSILLPSRFVSACINGHLADFPYGWWVHAPDMNSCKDAWGKNLEIQDTGKSGGLESIIIRCRTCKKERSMAGCLGKDSLRGFGCSGHMPWLGPGKTAQCQAVPRGMQRGSSGIWYSLTASALSLPSARTEMQKAVSEKWPQLEAALKKNPDEEKLAIILEVLFGSELEKNLFSMADLAAHVRERYNGANSGGEYGIRNLLEDEYAVLSTHEGEAPGDGKTLFRALPAQIPPCLSPYLRRVLLISRLREVMALYGFRRITPEEIGKNNPAFPGYNLERGYVPLGETRGGKSLTSWLPAVEMLGEGIFIELEENALKAWEEQNRERYERMASNLAASNVGCPNFSARFVLLHTLSHLLARQLALECGYSGASIKERIYSTFPDSNRQMAGIILYTSSTDTDGSLGGLVRNGKPENLERIFLNMLREASWCSTDPVCAESSGQGFANLNYAACHACALLPETSCVMRNCLLDRIAVKGTVDNPEMGLFHKLMRPGLEA